MNEEFEKQSRRIADSSGFPLQIRIADIVRNSQKWRVILEEHPWSLEQTQSEGFIDIVIEGQYADYQTMVIECKRVHKAKWVFLIPKSSPEKTTNLRIWESRYTNSIWSIFGFIDDHAKPESYESKFCAVLGQESGRKTLLERTASELVDSVEALAEQEKNLKRDPTIANELGFTAVYTPVIVTTAELGVAFFEPSSISLADGSLSPDTNFEIVPYVRFRKSLSGNIMPAHHKTLQDAHKEIERSVFVVNAEGFADFLDKFSID